MKQSLKIGFVAVVVAAFAASGLALAQSDGSEQAPPSIDVPTTEFAPAGPGFGKKGPGGPHEMRGGPGHLDAVAEFLGIDDPQVIVDALEAGDTLADVAAANGSSGEALVAGLVADLSEKLAESVADGRIDQARADEILVNAEERITELVNSTQDEIQAARQAQRDERQAEREARRTERQQNVAAVVGIPFEDIQAALQEGETTLAEIAAEQGVDLETLVDGLTAPAVANLAEKVADGTLTQEEADERLAEITERITERVQTVPESLEGFGGRDGNRGPRRGGVGGGGGGFGPATGVGVGLNA
jgi:hypothetical protein